MLPGLPKLLIMIIDTLSDVTASCLTHLAELAQESQQRELPRGLAVARVQPEGRV